MSDHFLGGVVVREWDVETLGTSSARSCSKEKSTEDCMSHVGFSVIMCYHIGIGVFKLGGNSSELVALVVIS